MSKHTPGPWLLVETPDDVMISDWHIQIGEYPVKLFPFVRQYSECRKFSGLITDRQKMADAKLIAAAPDLLEALEFAEETLAWAAEPYQENVDLQHDAKRKLIKVRVVIAKARGEPCKQP